MVCGGVAARVPGPQQPGHRLPAPAPAVVDEPHQWSTGRPPARCSRRVRLLFRWPPARTAHATFTAGGSPVIFVFPSAAVVDGGVTVPAGHEGLAPFPEHHRHPRRVGLPEAVSCSASPVTPLSRAPWILPRHSARNRTYALVLDQLDAMGGGHLEPGAASGRRCPDMRSASAMAKHLTEGRKGRCGPAGPRGRRQPCGSAGSRRRHRVFVWCSLRGCRSGRYGKSGGKPASSSGTWGVVRGGPAGPQHAGQSERGRAHGGRELGRVEAGARHGH